MKSCCCCCYVACRPLQQSLEDLRSNVCVTDPAAAANTYVYDAVTVEELDLSSSDSEDDQPPAAASTWPSLPWRARPQDRPAAVVAAPTQTAPCFRTRPCFYYQQGTCNRGDQCTYSHDSGSPSAGSLHPDAAFKAGPAHSRQGPQGAPPQAQGPLRSFLSIFRPGSNGPRPPYNAGPARGSPAPFQPQPVQPLPAMHIFAGSVRVLPHQVSCPSSCLPEAGGLRPAAASAVHASQLLRG